MFLAPILYVFHAIMTGIALDVCNLLGLAFTTIYFAIKKFNLKTLGIEATEILEAIGSSSNIENIDACVTRIRLLKKH